MKDMHVRLLIMGAIHFVLMYSLMYAMVNSIANIYPSFNQFYMAGIMTGPMLLLEGILMGSMYENRKMLTAIMAGSIILFVICFLFIRQQTLIGDTGFLKSMIPHHAGAILMCEKGNIKDPQIKQLCQSIISSQQSEIDWMKKKLNDPEGTYTLPQAEKIQNNDNQSNNGNVSPKCGLCGQKGIHNVEGNTCASELICKPGETTSLSYCVSENESTKECE